MRKSPEMRVARADAETLKLVFRTDRMHKKAELTVGGATFADAFNDREPYDRKGHVFYVPEMLLYPHTLLRLRLRDFVTGVVPTVYKTEYGSPVVEDGDALFAECDNGLTEVSSEELDVCDGVSYRHIVMKRKDGAPVHVFTLTATPRKAGLYLGTPGDGYAARRVKATIPDMIDAARKSGVNVVASVNGDFFDMFGDASPSGLAVKNGRVIANADSARPFIGMTKTGDFIVADLAGNPDALGRLECAAAGLQRIVKNGEVYDWAPLESFGYTPHPRTAAGVTADGKAVLCVVDGRIPDYSNGATLVDLAKLMLSFGCVDAVNLDGGGSSAVYVSEGDGFELKSVPADLFKPNDRLIRKEANCVMVTAR